MQAKTLKVLSGALAVAVAGSGYVAFRTIRPKAAAVVARTTTATTGTVTETISASGSVQAAATVNVTAPATATFLELPVAIGDTVTTGQVLAKLDPSTAENQLATSKTNLASARAKLQQSLDGLTTQERAQLTISAEQSSAQVKSAARSLSDVLANTRQTSATYATAVETARVALDAAVRTAELNAANYRSAIDTAQSSLDNAKASALINEKTYQAAMDNAQASLDNARKTADLNARSYQNSVDQAQTAVENAKTNAGFSGASANNALNQATLTLSNEITTLQQYQADLTAAQIAFANNVGSQSAVDAAQNKVTAQTKTVANAQVSLTNQQTNAASTAAKDSQSIKSAEQNTLFNALTGQTLGLAKDQQSIVSAEIALKNAATSRESGLAKDAQSIASAETALRNAVASQASGLLKDAQSVTQAENSLRNAIASQTSGLLKDRQSASSAQAALANAELSLRGTRVANSLKLAPAKQADILSLQAQVTSAEVAVKTAEQTLADTTIVSRVNGVVTSMTGTVGDSAGQGPFATITTVDDLEIKVGFSEANAAKLRVGQRGIISFDALPSVAISSVVQSVDQVATSVQNVATYYVLLKVPGGSAEGVKPGMTSSVEIVVNEAIDAVVVSSSAISTFGGRKSVTVRKDGVDSRTVVETGIVGSQGTEVISGVADGDVLVLPTATGTGTGTIRTTGTGTGGPGGVGGAGGVPVRIGG